MPRIPSVEKIIDLKLAERAEGKRENEKPLLFILFSSLEKEETFFVWKQNHLAGNQAPV